MLHPQTTDSAAGWETVDAFLNDFIVAYLAISKPNSFGLVFCSSQQLQKLIDLMKGAGVTATVVITKKPYSLPQASRNLTRGPINCIEYAVHLVRGNPTWANYGKNRDGEVIKFQENFLDMTDLWPIMDGHPFAKPYQIFQKWIKCYSEPRMTVVDAFAGTCSSVQGALKRGVNLYLVEKSEAFTNRFKNVWWPAVQEKFVGDKKVSIVGNESLVAPEASQKLKRIRVTLGPDPTTARSVPFIMRDRLATDTGYSARVVDLNFHAISHNLGDVYSLDEYGVNKVYLHFTKNSSVGIGFRGLDLNQYLNPLLEDELLDHSDTNLLESGDEDGYVDQDQNQDNEEDQEEDDDEDVQPDPEEILEAQITKQKRFEEALLAQQQAQERAERIQKRKSVEDKGKERMEEKGKERMEEETSKKRTITVKPAGRKPVQLKVHKKSRSNPKASSKK